LTNTGAPLTGVRDGAAQWVDDDGDGDLDIFLTGTNGSNPVAQLYRNTNGSFAPVGTAITPVANSMAAWGDYDNDGDLDLLLSGRSSGGLITHLYRNNGGASFTNRNLGLPGLEQGAVAWADYDGDHDIDLLLTGNNGSGPFAALYRNESNSFTGDHFVNSGISLTGVDQSAVAWA
ncbi:MAG: VCBS repeat-containing protein, partial [Calditrichaeota bacterium]|nr:VCBS repeat-containing protein [Calditrichota bacterium]